MLYLLPLTLAAYFLDRRAVIPDMALVAVGWSRSGRRHARSWSVRTVASVSASAAGLSSR
jgi:hypothetical protein